MKDRLKMVRKSLSLTQTEFGEKVGVKGNTITNYENGLRNPSDAVIFSICREFNINEKWLRTGEGEMYISAEDRYILNLGKLSKSENEFVQNAINYLAETEPDKLKVVEELMKKLLGIE